MQNITLNTFGHLPTCCNVAVPNSLRPKPVCRKMNSDGSPCNSIVCKIGCITKNQNGEFLGYCNTHWIERCESESEWDDNLSRCANCIADKKNLSLEERQLITHLNINKKLDVPLRFSDNNHFSLQRTQSTINATKQEQGEVDRQRIAFMQQMDKIKATMLRARFPSEESSDRSEEDESYERDSFVVSDDESESVESEDEMPALKRKSVGDLNDRQKKKPKY